MAYMSDFKFSNMSRIGNDDCSMSQRNVQNTEAANWSLANFFLADCNMNKAVSSRHFATRHQFHWFTSGRCRWL